MLLRLYESQQPPAFHDDLLILKLRPTAANLASSLGAQPMGIAGAQPAFGPMGLSHGLALLSVYERSGFIKRVVPLGKRTRARGAGAPLMGVATMLSTAAASDQVPQDSTGVNILELQEGTNVDQLRMSLGADPNVEFVSRVPIRYLMGRARQVPRAPRAAGGATIAATPPAENMLWNLQKIRWYDARQTLNLADDVRVAVLDTGIDLGHPDLPGSEINYVHDYPESQASASDQDIIGHGSHVSGTIRAIIDNHIGIDGISKCKLSVYKIFGDDTAPDPIPTQAPYYYPYYVDPILYRAALAAALDDGIQVINLSIGGYGAPDPQERTLFQSLIQGGVSVVAAMGNDNTSNPSYPAAFDGVIGVGATAADDTRAQFSNSGPNIALSAPGVGIWSTLPTYPGQTGFYAVRGAAGGWIKGAPMTRETDYDAWDGTSMACPHVTASAALAIAKYGTLSPAAMKAKLQAAVDVVPDMQGQNFTNYYGSGRLNLLKL
jgi:subtilisin family serine protease